MVYTKSTQPAVDYRDGSTQDTRTDLQRYVEGLQRDVEYTQRELNYTTERIAESSKLLQERSDISALFKMLATFYPDCIVTNTLHNRLLSDLSELDLRRSKDKE